MKGSLKIGTVAGVPIRVHWSFLLLALLVVAAGGGTSAAVVLGLWIVALFASVTVHELAHSIVAKRLGMTVKDIVLLPIGGMSEIERMSPVPSEELRVAIVGPLTSLALGALLVGLALALGMGVWPPTLVSGSWLARLGWMNVVLAGFNLLPAIPMDGGRVLRALLARRRGPVRATAIAADVSYGIGVAMIVVGLWIDWWLLFIGAFVMAGASGERRNAAVRAAFEGVRVRDLMVPEPVPVQAAVTAGQLAPWLAGFPGRVLPVVEWEDGPFLGTISMSDLVGSHPDAPVGPLCDRRTPVIEAQLPVVPDAVDAFASSQREVLAVSDAGRVVGVLYLSTVESALRRSRGSAGAGIPPRGGGWQRSGGTRQAA